MGQVVDVDQRGFLTIDLLATPIARAHLGDMHGPGSSSNDWRRELAWIRARTSFVLLHIEGDRVKYWAGEGPAPDHSTVRPWNDDILGHVDHVADAHVWDDDAHARRSLRERPGVVMSDPRFVHAELRSLTPRNGSDHVETVRFICREPHRLSGWWGVAAGLDPRFERNAVAARGARSGAGPLLAFERGPARRQVSLRLLVDDARTRADELISFGGRLVAPEAGEAFVVEDPEGNRAVLRDAAS